MKAKKTIKYIDLFAGLGGIRLGFKQACEAAGYDTNCVLTAEIKTAAVKALTTNFGVHTIHGDVTTIDSSEIPNFDFLLASSFLLIHKAKILNNFQTFQPLVP